MRCGLLSVALALWAEGGALAAGGDLRVPRFEITDSPASLHGDAASYRYVGVIGRGAAWLGDETGQGEIWVHPFKLASHFSLSFWLPSDMTAVRGAEVARSVTLRPELTTVTYSHPAFTVREHILAPLSEPGLLLLLDVETLGPLEIEVSFQSLFQTAWPAAFGGQYTYWDEDEKAFILSESLRENNAVIGSPWASRASSHPAHALSEAPNRFVIEVEPEAVATELIPIGIVAGTVPRETLLEFYRDLLRRAEAFYRERRLHVERLTAETTLVATPDEELNRALFWSKINLDEALCCNPELGCGLVAGWAPSGSTTRPGFGWFFGGDAAINSLAMDALGMWAQVAEGLRFLARYQREDGKIPHEISQAAKRIPWFTKYPYAYYHADTTPYWIVALWQYWRASSDEALLRELEDSLRKAYAWCVATDTDGDGIIENTSGGLGAVEVGELGEGIHQDIYLAGVWIEALGAMEEMARHLGQEELGRDASALRAKAWERLNQGYWREREGYHAFAILRSGKTSRYLTVWPATAAAFGLLDLPRARSTLVHLSRDRISSDWGARMLSTESPLYDPLHYNHGTVWPFVTGFLAWAQYSYGRPWSGLPLIDAMKQMSFDWARGRHPELLSGGFYRPLDTAVPQQFFSTSMLVTAVMKGMLGWEPQAARSRARLAPQLPPQWRRVEVKNLKVGLTTMDVVLQQEAEAALVEVRGRGPELELELAWPIPPGARNVKGTPHVRVEASEGQWALVRVRVGETTRRVRIGWSGGLRIEPPRRQLIPGQPSKGLRVLDWRFAEGAWSADLEGVAGATYELKLFGETPSRVEGAKWLAQEKGVSTLAVTFPAGAGRVDQRIRLKK